MKRFVFGTDDRFNRIDEMLNDGNCHLVKNCVLPDCCEPSVSNIGFSKCNNGYRLQISYNIRTSSDNRMFESFLHQGEQYFNTLEDMKNFFYSLKPLYKKEVEDELNEKETVKNSEEITDKAKIRKVKEEKVRKKIVWPEDISTPLKTIIFGQNEAIDLLAENIVINNLSEKDKILVLCLLGPPATGKSETGRNLANILSNVTGVRYGHIEIEANQYGQEHSVMSLLGAPPSYKGYGEKTLLEPVRDNPYHIILINEVEKSHESFLVSLMEAFDTGFLPMNDNSPAIDLRKSIILLTSNLPVNMGKYEKASKYARSEMCKDIFTDHCGRPEISRRIREFLVFKPLSEDAQIDIIIKFTRQAVEDYGATLMHIDECLIAEFLSEPSKYGASEIRNRVYDAVGNILIRNRNKNLLAGAKINLKGSVEHIEFEIV